ncbi:MAG: amino acid ABC transporter permease [Hyphomicrobiales bacterium]|jgi:His/Glu/Gln/Arg/opine family amino acid ABC transporter permease subunit
MTDFFTFAWTYLPYLAKGLVITAELTGLAFVGSCVLGLLGAMAKGSKHTPLRYIGNIYVEVMRGTPALLQIFVIYFGLASYGVRLDPFSAAVITLSVLGGAYVTEIIRAGIEAVDRGQIEAAISLAMTPAQIMRRIILPQASLIILPPFTNYLISLIKDTSLALTISVPEIMYRSYDVASQTFRSMDIYVVAGLIYLAICFPLSRLSRWLELKRPPR